MCGRVHLPLGGEGMTRVTASNSGRMNVILLVVDGLRYDRLGQSGYTPSPSPTLDRLMSASVTATHTFAPGSPTQFSLPSIFTSSLPLDYGGYDEGIGVRPHSFVECIRNAGHATCAFVTGSGVNGFFGYDRGFDEFYDLTQAWRFLRTVWKSYLMHFVTLYDEGVIEFDELVETARGPIERVFDHLEQYIAKKLDEIGGGRMVLSPNVHAADYASMAKQLAVEKAQFLCDTRSFFEQKVVETRRLDILSDFPGFGATDFTPAEMIRKRVVNRLRLPLRKAGVGFCDAATRSTDAGVLVDNLIRWIDRVKDRPFFNWTHFMDAHDLLYGPGGVMLPPVGTRFFWRRQRHRRSYRGLISYDYAIAYVDRQVRRLLGFLEARGLRDQTLIVFGSDHGVAAGWPRPDVSQVGSFYEEHIRVPLAFSHPDLTPRIVDGLCTTMDIGPTILDVLGVARPASFIGRPVYDPEIDSREHVVLENLGRGACDVTRKPIRMAIRSKNEKAVFFEDPERLDGVCVAAEAYDLRADPDEFENLLERNESPAYLERFRALAEERCRDIRRQAVRQSV